jgi:hypothetical protein
VTDKDVAPGGVVRDDGTVEVFGGLEGNDPGTMEGGFGFGDSGQCERVEQPVTAVYLTGVMGSLQPSDVVLVAPGDAVAGDVVRASADIVGWTFAATQQGQPVAAWFRFAPVDDRWATETDWAAETLRDEQTGDQRTVRDATIRIDSTGFTIAGKDQTPRRHDDEHTGTLDRAALVDSLRSLASTVVAAVPQDRHVTEDAGTSDDGRTSGQYKIRKPGALPVTVNEQGTPREVQLSRKPILVQVDAGASIDELVSVLDVLAAERFQAVDLEVALALPQTWGRTKQVKHCSFGPGGAETGWGTVGTGRYGTIGHGSGTGSGYGAGRGHTGKHAGVPVMRLGQPSAVGDLDKAIIRRYVRRSQSKLQYCYEKALLAAPGLAGTVSAQFFIGEDGIVATSNASGMSSDVASCVAGVIKSITFPKPKGGGGVQVAIPFTFSTT